MRSAAISSDPVWRLFSCLDGYNQRDQKNDEREKIVNAHKHRPFPGLSQTACRVANTFLCYYIHCCAYRQTTKKPPFGRSFCCRLMSRSIDMARLHPTLAFGRTFKSGWRCRQCHLAQLLYHTFGQQKSLPFGRFLCFARLWRHRARPMPSLPALIIPRH